MQLLWLLYAEAKSGHNLAKAGMHSPYLRHLREIAEGSHYTLAMEQNLCCLLCSVGSLSTQLLALVYVPRNLGICAILRLRSNLEIVSSPDPTCVERGSGDIWLIPWASLKIRSLLYA